MYSSPSYHLASAHPGGEEEEEVVEVVAGEVGGASSEVAEDPLILQGEATLVGLIHIPAEQQPLPPPPPQYSRQLEKVG